MMERHWYPADRFIPPHPVSRPEQVDTLYEAFRKAGWNPRAPWLLGYPYYHMIHLLSGTHRHEAARRANILIPVIVLPYLMVESRYGHVAAWKDMMRMGDWRAY